MSTADEVFESRFMIFWGRASLAAVLPVLGLLYTLSISPLQASLSTLDARIASLEKINSDFTTHFAVIDSTMIRGKADREAFQQRTEATLDKIQQTQVDMAKAMAALTAILEEMRRSK